MPNFDLMLAFISATVVFAYMPGPALLYTAAQTISRGRKAGLMAALGIHLGGYVHVFAAALGLSIVFKAVPTLYIVLKFIGAAYLIFLGLKLIFQSKNKAIKAEKITEKTGKQAFIESITVEVLNPKTAIFFIAFLPQFTSPDALFPIWLQFFILGTIVNIVFASADLLSVFMAGAIVKKLQKSSNFQIIAEYIGGTLLIGLGLKLALHKN